jgi:hypothetical protein
VLALADQVASPEPATVDDLAMALFQLHPEYSGRSAPLGRALYLRLGQALPLMRSVAATLQQFTTQETTTLTTITDAIAEFQTAADQAHADSATERDVTDRAIAAMTALENALANAGLSPAQEAAVASALTELGQVHTDLVQRVSDLGTADTTGAGAVPPAATPPPATPGA